MVFRKSNFDKVKVSSEHLKFCTEYFCNVYHMQTKTFSSKLKGRRNYKHPGEYSSRPENKYSIAISTKKMIIVYLHK